MIPILSFHHSDHYQLITQAWLVARSLETGCVVLRTCGDSTSKAMVTCVTQVLEKLVLSYGSHLSSCRATFRHLNSTSFFQQPCQAFVVANSPRTKVPFDFRMDILDLLLMIRGSLAQKCTQSWSVHTWHVKASSASPKMPEEGRSHPINVDLKMHLDWPSGPASIPRD